MIHTKTYAAPLINRREILRYAGAKDASADVVKLTDDAISEAENALTYKVCWGEFPVIRREDTLDLGFATADSSALIKNLTGCDRVILLAATVGLELDRLIARYGVQSPAKALMLQAIGAERIEALCDQFERDICRQLEISEYALAPRFSPGYGDLPLEFQREIFRVLDCSRRIGLTLNESLLMSPSKSVTAIIGIKNTL